jgi:hypothetical protein
MIIRFILACGLVLLPIDSSWALRCGNNLVVEGDYMIEVLRKCGEPYFKQTRVEIRGVRLNNPGIEQYVYYPVNIEEWTYNFGPTRFMEVLKFEDNRLIATKPLGYGD